MLHYEFVPGLRQHEMDTKGPFFWYWTLSIEDDLGTPYRDDNGGAFDPGGETAAHETRYLGAPVPRSVDRSGGRAIGQPRHPLRPRRRRVVEGAGCRHLHRRYERRADHFAFFVTIAAALICHRRLTAGFFDSGGESL
ncbi:hypothetical protein ACTMTI_24860 [Nonomuraea sp. H19]|uniref:hypothetical protein n=1 Tax=Nonomuraea sp. H19 TaxID=3452206 RepID=UPI003F8A786D